MSPEETRVFKGLDAQRLVVLFCAGWALLSYPLLALGDHDLTVWGLPMLPVVVFGVWLALIVAAAWVLERPAD
jgi:hypothetical protein